MNQEQRLSKAKTSLILDHPFVGTVALSTPFEFDESIPTAATNGKRVLFNPKFVESLDDEELLFLVAHECMHPMLEHNYRRNNRDHSLWNAACDYVINKLLVDERIGRMPRVGLIDHKLYEQGEGISDNIYKLLEQDPNAQGNGGLGDVQLDNCEDADGSPAEVAQQRAQWQIKTAQAAQAAKLQGKLSANMKRFVDMVLEPKVNWKEVLRNFLVKSRTDSRSYARFNRRFLSQGMYLPSTSGEAMGHLVVAVDCSGSVGQEELNQFASELQAIKEDLCPVKLSVMYFDTEVSHVDEYEHDDEVEVIPHGGGGTDFAPIFEKLQELGEEPEAVVVLSDMYCNSFGYAPECPVIWVATERGGSTPPWGELVNM